MYRSSTTVQYWERNVDYLRFAAARCSCPASPGMSAILRTDRVRQIRTRPDLHGCTFPSLDERCHVRIAGAAQTQREPPLPDRCRGGFRLFASRAYNIIASTPSSSMRAGWRPAIAYRSALACRPATKLAPVPGRPQAATVAAHSASASLDIRRCQSSSSTAPPTLPPASNDLRRLMRKVAQPVAVITANLKDASSIHEPGEHE